MLKKVLSVLVLAAFLISASFGTVEAKKVYIDSLDAGTKIYVEDISVHGEPNKFMVTMYFDEKSTTAIFSASGILAMAIIGGQTMMVNGNSVLEKVFKFCQSQF